MKLTRLLVVVDGHVGDIEDMSGMLTSADMVWDSRGAGKIRKFRTLAHVDPASVILEASPWQRIDEIDLGMEIPRINAWLDAERARQNETRANRVTRQSGRGPRHGRPRTCGSTSP